MYAQKWLRWVRAVLFWNRSFLPEKAAFSTHEKPVAIISGGGTLALELAHCLNKQNKPFRILALRGFAERSVRMIANAHSDLLDIKRSLSILEKWSPAAVVLAGPVHRPKPSAALSAFAYFRNRDEIAKLMDRGDDALLRAAIEMLEKEGHKVIGIADLAPELLAGEGVLGSKQPEYQDKTSVKLGFQLLQSLSPFDMGQAAVLCGERVAAVEGPEGTDAMIARVGGLWRTPRLRRLKQGGVVVKAAKLGQDLRVDLPAVGPRTIYRAAKARLSGIAVQTGRTLLLERAKTLKEADRLGLFVVGVRDERDYD